ncbi:hypothetical protein AXF42_Ash007814 [Apostasia shenzhenica]|uniref:Uncharacterized protein n=1 Tax=Apostasia shenzhenica TaxID=1088818 RepID=A0A2I0B5E8_9ASPA|nr:hypothetical protein AXF42_Ash007814 [Apostasia shenzhenica]
MASVGGLLLVFFLCASTAPALTFAQSINFNNILEVIGLAHFSPIHANPLYAHIVAHVALDLYHFNARYILYPSWPEINNIVGVTGVSVAVSLFRSQMVSIYGVMVDARVAGMFDDEGEEIRRIIIEIFFAVPLGQSPMAQNVVPASLHASFPWTRTRRGN